MKKLIDHMIELGMKKDNESNKYILEKVNIKFNSLYDCDIFEYSLSSNNLMTISLPL